MAMYSDYDNTVSFEVLSTSPNPRKLFGSAMTREHAHMHTSTKRSVEAYRNIPGPRTRPPARATSTARGQSVCSPGLQGCLVIRPGGADQQQRRGSTSEDIYGRQDLL